MSQSTICNVCHLMPRTVSVTAGYRVRCVHGECCWGPVRPSEAEANAAWNKMMRPAGLSVEMETRPHLGDDALVTLYGPRQCLEGTLHKDLFRSLGPGYNELLSRPQRFRVELLTITAVRTEAEPPKWTAPSWCKDDEDGLTAPPATLADCERHRVATREDCDGCRYCAAEDDTSPVPSDVARLHKMVEDLTGVVAKVTMDSVDKDNLIADDVKMLVDKLREHKQWARRRALELNQATVDLSARVWKLMDRVDKLDAKLALQHERDDGLDMAIAKLAEVIENGDEVNLDATGGDLRAAISLILTRAEPAEPADSVEPDEPAEETRKVRLITVGGNLAGEIDVPADMNYDLIEFGLCIFGKTTIGKADTYYDITGQRSTYRFGESND